jgi:hypothetical protein
METDGSARRPANGETDLPDLAGLAWLAAVRRGDRGAFDTTVRHTQERLAAHLLGVLRLPPEQSIELTEQTVLDALETAGQETAIESPLARLFGTARARLRDRLFAAFGENAGLDLPFAPEPDSALLRAFYAGDPRLDRQLGQRRDLLPFFELMHEVLQSLPDDQRAAIEETWGPDDDTPYPTGLLAMAGAVLLAHTRPGYCAVFDEHISQAGWQPGAPFSHQLGLGLLYHVASCPECGPSQQQAEKRIAKLPPLVLWVALRLTQQRQAIMNAVFADEAGLVAGPVGPAVPAVVPVEVPPVATLLAPPGPIDAIGGDPGDPLPPVPRRRRRPSEHGASSLRRQAKRRLVTAGIVVGLLAISLVSWELAGGGDGKPAPLVLDTPAGNPLTTGPSGSGLPIGGDDTSPPVGTTAGPSSTAAPTTTPASTSASPSATGTSTAPGTTGGTVGSTSSSPSDTPSAPGTSTGTGTGTPTPGVPAGQLTVKMAPLSTGAVTVTIDGARAGACAGSATSCSFAVQPGQQVSLDSKDVVLSWGSSPCKEPRKAGNCTFTAAAKNQADPLVLRLAL